MFIHITGKIWNENYAKQGLKTLIFMKENFIIFLIMKDQKKEHI